MLEGQVATQAGAVAPGAIGRELQAAALDGADSLILADIIIIGDKRDQVIDLPAVKRGAQVKSSRGAVVEHQFGGVDLLATEAWVGLLETGLFIEGFVGVGRAVRTAVQELERIARAGAPDQADTRTELGAGAVVMVGAQAEGGGEGVGDPPLILHEEAGSVAVTAVAPIELRARVGVVADVLRDALVALVFRPHHQGVRGEGGRHPMQFGTVPG